MRLLSKFFRIGIVVSNFFNNKELTKKKKKCKTIILLLAKFSQIWTFEDSLI